MPCLAAGFYSMIIDSHHQREDDTVLERFSPDNAGGLPEIIFSKLMSWPD